jgi:hypothetical protein
MVPRRSVRTRSRSEFHRSRTRSRQQVRRLRRHDTHRAGTAECRGSWEPACDISRTGGAHCANDACGGVGALGIALAPGIAASGRISSSSPLPPRQPQRPTSWRTSLTVAARFTTHVPGCQASTLKERRGFLSSVGSVSRIRSPFSTGLVARAGIVPLWCGLPGWQPFRWCRRQEVEFAGQTKRRPRHVADSCVHRPSRCRGIRVSRRLDTDA